MKDDISDSSRIDAAHRGGHMDPTHGIQALMESLGNEVCPHCGCNPTTLAGAVISEEFRRAMGYFFADGRPDRKGWVARRVLAWLRLVAPAVAHKVPAAYWAVLASPIVANHSWRADEFLLPPPKNDACEFCGTAAEMLEWRMAQRMRRYFAAYLSGDRPEDLDALLVRTYAFAKALAPEVLEERLPDGSHRSMSLHRLGTVFEEKNEVAGRARWSARVKKVYNERLATRGFVAHAKFQKNESTCAKYAAAQVGNTNKRGKKAKPRKTTTPCSLKLISPASPVTRPTAK